MDTVSVRELRNNGGRVLQRVAGGETLTVTMDGHPIAELRPIAERGLGGHAAPAVAPADACRRAAAPG